MSLNDDYYDLVEWMKDKPKYYREAFDTVWRFSIDLENQRDELLKENIAMRKVIKIIKS